MNNFLQNPLRTQSLIALVLLSLVLPEGSSGSNEAATDNNVRPIRQSPTVLQEAQSPSADAGSTPLPITASLPLKDLILILMAKHGDGPTSRAFGSLDKKPLGEVMQILLSKQVDKALSQDILAMQAHAQTSDKQLVSVIARIVAGDGSVANDVFAYDEKLRKYPWWARMRQRMFVNMDKYVGTFKNSVNANESAVAAIAAALARG